jgi:tRNA threonylcarbamoyladenosine biosynthesis protein TsaB
VESLDAATASSAAGAPGHRSAERRRAEVGRYTLIDMTTCLLALDTSTDRLAAALQTPGGRWCVDEAGGAAASARLIPLLMGLLEAAGIGPAQLQAIAFGRGPGAFTGLRTACAVAQGLAFAHDTPVLAVDSLLIVAEQARSQAGAAGESVDGSWWVAMDARMDEVYAAAYRHRPDTGWQTEVAPRLWTLPALVAAWDDAPPVRVAGNAVAAFGERLPTGAAAVWPLGSARAAALLALAGQAWERGEGGPADLALPLYLRDKVALTTAERLALRATRAASSEPA